MNILMLAPLPPPSGGIASWTVRYKRFCEENGIPLRIVNISLQGERATKEVMKRSLSVEFRRTLSILRNLKKEMRREKPDVIHLNTSCSRFGIMRDALCVFSIHGKVPVVLHCRCNIADQLGGRRFSVKLFGYLVKKAAAVIVLNKHSKKYTDDLLPGKAVFIPNFADEKILRENHPIRQELVNALYVGHVEKAKGIVQIAEAAKRFRDMRFTLVGAIREDLSYLDLPSNLSLVGRVSVDEIQKYLTEADVFVFPSFTEGFSNALLEAMAAGLPVVASDVGANSEMIETQGGIILRENTGQALCSALLALRDPEARKSMSEWNIRKVRDAYAIRKVMQEYFDIYEHVARG